MEIKIKNNIPVLTIGQRNIIYKDVLQKLNEPHTAQFMCCLLINSLEHFVGVQNLPKETRHALNNINEIELTIFPEFAKHKPKRTWASSVWFQRNNAGLKKRKKIIESCIEKTTKFSSE